MRIHQITEAPIADYSFHGPTEKGSFKDDDIRAATSPKWRVKLEKTFSSVHEMVNVVLINARNSMVGIGTGDPAYVSIHTLSDWAGCYKPEAFNKRFGFLPTEYQNRLNIILMSNEADERIPLTGWMVAHRFMHALGNSTTTYERLNTHVSRPFDDFFRAISQILIDIKFQQPYNPIDSQELFAGLSSFASARGGKIERNGEYIIDLATHYFLRGKLDFNYPAMVEDPQLRRDIESQVSVALASLNDCFIAAKGTLIVF